MPATPYKPVAWNGEPISNAKLQQMADNDQWLFENSPRIRYSSSNNLVRDAGLKVLAGKTMYGTSSTSAVYTDVYFGNFFSAGSHPVVVCTLETGTTLGRKQVTIAGFGGEVDHVGFRAAIYVDGGVFDGPPTIEAAGWLNWHAIGY